MTSEAWLRAHAWLVPLAQVRDRVDAALAGIAAPAAAQPCWDDYGDDYGAGVPLLHSTTAAIDLEPAGAMLHSLVDLLAASPAADPLTADARALSVQLRSVPSAGPRIVEWLLGGDAFAPCAPGLLRHLGWTTMARWLHPLLDAFARWRVEDRWLRGHCPACGSAPCMAQLVGVDPERKRLLACGCCGSRWRYQRTACPFCENDAQRIGIVAIEGESGLRIDYCEACKGYLKTYVGQGQEALLLADWTSLHLDVIAHDRGLQRKAESLYDLEAVLQQAARPPD